MSLTNVLQYLADTFKQADEAASHLNISFDRCKPFINSHQYTEVELIELEALTSRFAWLSDLLIQKIFKTIDQLDANTPGTVRDRILQAEKKGLVTDSGTLMEIRNVRNTIAHEYESLDLKELFLFIFRHTSVLLEILDNSKKYATRFF